MAQPGLHEDTQRIAADTLDQHRAIESLREELEAVDWYKQRADATADPELRRILLHNMDEELEHAAMVLEWLRRNNDRVDHYLRAILFRDAAIAAHDHDRDNSQDHALRVGSTRRA